MKIDWASLGLVALVTVAVTVVVVGIYALGVGAANAADSRISAGQRAGAPRFASALCMGVCALIVAFGLYLIVPYFH